MAYSFSSFFIYYSQWPTLLAHCLYYMSPLNHKRTTSSLAPHIFYVEKNWQLKDWRLPISPTFYEQLLRQYYFAKKLQSQIEMREKLWKTYKKSARKMLVKLTLGHSCFNWRNACRKCLSKILFQGLKKVTIVFWKNKTIKQ